MKKNFVKRMLSCVLATTLVTGALVGCGNQNQKESSVAGSSTSEKTTAVSEVSKEAKEATEEPAKLVIMHDQIGNYNYDDNSLSGLWQKQLEEACNIEIEWQVPASGSYNDAVQLALLDDNRPDVILMDNSWMSNVSFLDACETGMFTDISGLIENYPNLMKHTNQVSWEALDLLQDGRIWGFPRSTVARADGFLVKKEWIDAVGMDIQEGDYLTLDEFYELLYAFTYNDPDGNGVNDTFGISAYENNGTLFTGIDRIFHVGGWYEFPDGTIDSVKYSKNYDYYKQYLEFMNKCWEAGVIDSDAYVLDSKSARDRETNYGIRTGYAASLDVTVDEKSPTTEIFIPGVVVEGDPVGAYRYGEYSNGIWNFYAISSTCEHPEKVLELVDYMLSDEQWVNLNAKSLEGVGFVIDENGNYDYSLRDAIAAKDKENGTYLQENVLFTSFVRRSDAPEYFINKSYSKEVRDRLTALVQISFDNYWPTLDRGYKPEISKEQTYIEYENFIKAEESKIITGDKPVEYWDELLDGFYKAGYEKYRTDMLEYIASFK